MTGATGTGTAPTRLRRMAMAIMRGDVTWFKYLFASVVALAADTGAFMLLLHDGLGAIPSAVTGYIIGMAVHWLVSTRAVFAGETASRGTGARQRQMALFVGSALIGLALTTAIVGGGSALGLDPRLAKLAAIIISFQATYMLRRHVVFRG